jgi:antitoxin (DNA-binding transcriptional repressor) of toxin-antitoxin stability system
VKLTATEFRRSLFPLLERVLRGESVEFVYKGSTVKVVAAHPSSKLARAKRQNALLVDPDSIVHSDAELIGGMESEWRKDWKSL